MKGIVEQCNSPKKWIKFDPAEKALISEMQSIILFYQTKNLCCLEMDFKMNLFIENQFLVTGESSLSTYE